MLVASADVDSSSISSGECSIYVPSLNMSFTTNKLQTLNIIGNIFDGSKSTHPLTIYDYISILIDNDKYLDNELLNMINTIPSLSSRYKCLNQTDNSG